MELGTTMGPLINQKAVEKVRDFLSDECNEPFDFTVHGIQYYTAAVCK